MSKPKIKIVLDDNHSLATQDCGYILTGDIRKRTTLAKLHRKKCDICKNISVRDCVEIPARFIPLNKQRWAKYENGVNRKIGEFKIEKRLLSS